MVYFFIPNKLSLLILHKPSQKEVIPLVLSKLIVRNYEIQQAGLINLICPGLFLSDHAPGKPDKKILLKFVTVILCNDTKKWYKKNFEIAAIKMMPSLIMSMFLNNYAKNG